MLTMSPFGGVIMRHRQSSEMIATHWPVRSMGASARAVDTGACVARLCAPTARVDQQNRHNKSGLHFLRLNPLKTASTKLSVVHAPVSDP